MFDFFRLPNGERESDCIPRDVQQTLDKIKFDFNDLEGVVRQQRLYLASLTPSAEVRQTVKSVSKFLIGTFPKLLVRHLIFNFSYSLIAAVSRFGVFSVQKKGFVLPVDHQPLEQAINRFDEWLRRSEETVSNQQPLTADLILLREEEIAHKVGM